MRPSFARYWMWLLVAAIVGPAFVGGPVLALFLDLDWALLLIPASLLASGIVLGATVLRAPRLGRGWALAVALLVVVEAVGTYLADDEGGLFLESSSWPLVFVAIALAVLLPTGLGQAIGSSVVRWRQARWRAAEALAIYLALALIPVGTQAGVGQPHRHADAVMEANFRAHVRDFQQLAEMASQDASVVRITDTVTTPAAAGGARLAPARWDAYRRLFAELGLKNGLRRDGDRVYFRYWPTVLMTGGDEKGYAYVPDTPALVVDRLDPMPIPIPSNEPIFRPLGDGWYLYYLSDWANAPMP